MTAVPSAISRLADEHGRRRVCTCGAESTISFHRAAHAIEQLRLHADRAPPRADMTAIIR